MALLLALSILANLYMYYESTALKSLWEEYEDNYKQMEKLYKEITDEKKSKN